MTEVLVKKRKQFITFLKKQFKLCFKQVTHSKTELESLWKRECKHHMFFSGRRSSKWWSVHSGEKVIAI